MECPTEWIQTYTAKIKHSLANGKHTDHSTRNTLEDSPTPMCRNTNKSRPQPSYCLPFKVMCWVGRKPHLASVVYVKATFHHTVTSAEWGYQGELAGRDHDTSLGPIALCGEVEGAVWCSPEPPEVHGAPNVPWGRWHPGGLTTQGNCQWALGIPNPIRRDHTPG